MLIRSEFMEIAEEEALRSPCVRRKYGVVITHNKEIATTAFNTRIGKCCNGSDCVRNRFKTEHAQDIEKGAEIHAEQAALLLWKGVPTESTTFYLAGYDKNGKLLTGKACRPCHLCAMLIKFAGFTHVVIRQSPTTITPVSISQIIEDHEEGWGTPYAI